MFGIISQYFGNGFLLALGAIEAVMLTLFTMALANPDSRKTTLDWLRAPKGTKFYDRTVGGFLGKIDRALDNPKIANDGHTPWSASLFDVALRLAILYPILTLALYWGWTGNAAGFGDFDVFPVETRKWDIWYIWPDGLFLCFFWALLGISS